MTAWKKIKTYWKIKRFAEQNMIVANNNPLYLKHGYYFSAFLFLRILLRFKGILSIDSDRNFVWNYVSHQASVYNQPIFAHIITETERSYLFNFHD